MGNWYEHEMLVSNGGFNKKWAYSLIGIVLLLATTMFISACLG